MSTLLEMISKEAVDKLEELKHKLKQAETERKEAEYVDMTSEWFKETRRIPFGIIYDE